MSSQHPQAPNNYSAWTEKPHEQFYKQELIRYRKVWGRDKAEAEGGTSWSGPGGGTARQGGPVRCLRWVIPAPELLMSVNSSLLSTTVHSHRKIYNC